MVWTSGMIAKISAHPEPQRGLSLWDPFWILLQRRHCGLAIPE